MTVAEQVNYESSVRFRYGVIAFCAALLIVASQLIQLSGVHASVNELTLDLVAANQRVTLDVIGAALDMLGLAAVGVLLYWLHRISSARRPELKALGSLGRERRCRAQRGDGDRVHDHRRPQGA